MASRQPPDRDAERSESLIGEILIRAPDLGSTFRRQRPRLFTNELARASRDEDVRCALRKHDQAVVVLRFPMHRAHQLSLGRERHLA